MEERESNISNQRNQHNHHHNNHQNFNQFQGKGYFLFQATDDKPFHRTQNLFSYRNRFFSEPVFLLTPIKRSTKDNASRTKCTSICNIRNDQDNVRAEASLCPFVSACVDPGARYKLLFITLSFRV